MVGSRLRITSLPVFKEKQMGGTQVLLVHSISEIQMLEGLWLELSPTPAQK